MERQPVFCGQPFICTPEAWTCKMQCLRYVRQRKPHGNHVSPTQPEGPPRQTGWGQGPQHHPLHDIPPSEGNFERGVPQPLTDNICPSRGTPEKYGQGPHTKRNPAAGQHRRFSPEVPHSKGDTGWPQGHHEDAANDETHYSQPSHIILTSCGRTIYYL